MTAILDTSAGGNLQETHYYIQAFCCGINFNKINIFNYIGLEGMQAPKRDG
jgi:hypothetical protein